MVAPKEPVSARGSRRSPEPTAIVLVLSGTFARTDIDPLCARVRALLERGPADLVVCDVGELVEPDAATVDVLAHLQLVAKQLGRRVEVLDACGKLRDMIDLAGLTHVLPPVGRYAWMATLELIGSRWDAGPRRAEGLSLEPRGKAEEGEQAGGVEEEGDPSDPVT